MNLQQTADIANKASDVHWVKWIHPRTQPAYSSISKTVNAIVASIFPFHCARCLNMNGCCFSKDNCPDAPLHDNCHCRAEPIDGIAVTAECLIEKFTNYIFDKFRNKGKKALFESWGFTIDDSLILKSEIEKQAYISYFSGEYELGKFDAFGQRISIVVTINCKNGDTKIFKTGWMVYPDGKILLTTPFGGYVK